MTTVATGGSDLPRLERRIEVAADHPAFAGHFPGQPVLPGVSLLAEVLEAIRAQPRWRALAGPAPRLSVVKFIAPVLPGATLALGLGAGTGGIDFEIRDGERLAASGRIAFADRAEPA